MTSTRRIEAISPTIRNGSGRSSDPLKNLPLTLDAWRRLGRPRPELCLFGNQPELASDPGIRYVSAPSDVEVNELLNRATVFLQTSTHEGFCLPALEAMAASGAVVCTAYRTRPPSAFR